MGQLDSVNQAPVDSTKLTLSGIQFHDVHGSPPATNPAVGPSLDFNSIFKGKAGDQVAPAAAPAPPEPLHPAQAARPAWPLPDTQVVAPTTYQIPKPIQVLATPPRPVADLGQPDLPRPPHPDESLSTGEQVGGLFTTGLALGASVIAGKSLQSSVRGTEIRRVQLLREVTEPQTLESVVNQTDAVTRVVAEKARGAAADVDKIAAAKPSAFEEITELMPAKAPGKPPEQLVFQQVTDRGLLTEDELAVADRSEYLRSLERVLVKDFNIGNTSTVSAFRTRQPYIKGLGDSEAAVEEGLAAPLQKLESTANVLMGETTTGRLAMDKAATSSIYQGLGILAGSFVATRGIDHLIYGGKSQGMLTTAFDCAAPFLVLTNINPWAKIGIMVGGHELVRGIESISAANKDK